MTANELIRILIAFGISTLLGYYLVARLWSSPRPGPLLWSFVPAIGLGVSSLGYFAFRRPFFTLEFALVIIIIALSFRLGSLKNLPLPWPSPLFSIFFIAIGVSLPGLLLRVERMPHGNYDAWAIWNSHARVLYRSGASWPSNIGFTFHGDYPLLVPASIVRIWRYVGHEIPEAGALVDLLLMFSALAILTTTVAYLRSRTGGVVVGLVLLGTPSYLDHGSSQYADVPLSCFIVAALSFVSLCAEQNWQDVGLLVLAGLAAGLSGWTKNEGLLFILATCIALLLPAPLAPRRTLRRFAWYALGLVTPLVATILFKTRAPQNDLVQFHHDAFSNLLNPERHRIILYSFIQAIPTFGGWVVQPWLALFAFAVFYGFHRHLYRQRSVQFCTLVLGIMLGGYYLVYLLTPIDLQLHLDSSLGRLLTHLWPAFLLLLGLILRPEGYLSTLSNK
jgi:hypothetical protein